MTPARNFNRFETLVGEISTLHQLVSIGIYGAAARGLIADPAAVLEAMSEEIDKIREFGQLGADEIAALTGLFEVEEERHKKELYREMERAERHARAILRGAASRSLAEAMTEGFNPHGYFVYLLWGRDPNQPLYVGQSENILARLGAHMGDARKRSRVERVTLIDCATHGLMMRTEARLIAQHQPPWNTVGIRTPMAVA